jgi:acyl-CoA thioester hydrolase
MTDKKLRNYPIQIRFVDTDMMGHINNSVYLSYFEVARMYFFNDLFGDSIDWTREGIILARAELDYRKPLLINHTNVFCSISCVETGNKSFTLEYTLQNNEIVFCQAKTVMVYFDYASGKSEVLPTHWVKILMED